MAKCKFCNKEIVWMKDGRKSVPVEVDGAKHECEQFKNARDSARTLDRGTLSAEEIARYEEGINKKKKK